ncbi:4-galactosyl-N-acetylglucosaminide 3-alpha-L-fucosyltransferase 9-like [Ictalurus furcatus]|uniref:4-galactosyl-N-acetylglucosaminide 3-alpha-L-fucosyltransferase 9-like n=1 Tax=Ictalurus furcatus TaxID=66913 RepID=UPI00235023C2|nr:4-galactosyl-N-acetylglucosaminide 3-alpha-L-fucosyltransferase 9-like [Ictalurus furcatus]XP_053498465.1 4-galactosyl-N-acetylglucosaminide 3-alpha-L-fucosyltransferase 9-like [Ictalurus furcatus]XP_053498466.1 4-galactosyl-N-acetylglucosaminide 3-alpha-L-fucosyltransferase 9-like [Ictalurus furcatus]XP_053498467.1 4-galactosyl-N-acetylglucosaminide 3-alpha-L-fucosyltransferase 9-like [Ictalurus furcatus]XP_053498468.1 4-galactosyl-N-acetylglucosaminide 3-alpha-L-fucosyltransferase 9-like [
MAAKPSIGPFQHLLLPLFLLFCFGGVFYTYYKQTLYLSRCSDVPVSTHEVCSDKCLNVFQEIFIKNVTNSSTLNYSLVKQLPAITKTDVTDENKENNDRDTVILIWSWPFGFIFKAESCSPQFGIKGCHFTDDRSQYHKAHGVMFHHKDIGDDLPNLLNMPRPHHQRWVWMNMESPDNSQRWAGLDGLFNLTANYQRDSDVWVPYGRIREASEQDKPFEIPPKDKLVCWIVSNWNPNFRRVKYFNELSKHINIWAYGRHFNRYFSDDDYVATMSSCKFYLAFENSDHKDYFTEKLFNPMKFGTVPVVLGPPRENYEEFIPAESFIHVDDFKSPQELAEHLTLLDQNQEAYEQYFTWRQHFNVEGLIFGLEHACHICDHVRKQKGYRVVTSLSKWYWG